jgi:hypothetical protein
MSSTNNFRLTPISFVPLILIGIIFGTNLSVKVETFVGGRSTTSTYGQFVSLDRDFSLDLRKQDFCRVVRSQLTLENIKHAQ